MKIVFLTISICISVCISAQLNYSNNAKGFNSCFQKLDKGYFSGYADGLMQFEYNDGTKYIVSFSKDSAHLEIEPDTDKIYDISYKNYIVKKNEIQIKYSTYHRANALLITLGSKMYIFSLFDGASIDVIDGLDYEYFLKGGRELLVIRFSDRVGLYTTRHYTSPEIYILKGSTLTFTINR